MSDGVIKRALEVAGRAAGKPLANMHAGCFKPEDRSQRGDCADGDCYCIRVQKHVAAAAIAAFLRALPNTFLPFSGGGGGHWFASAATDTLAAAVEQEARDAG